MNALQGTECNLPTVQAIQNFKGYCSFCGDTQNLGCCGESQNLGFCNKDTGQCCCYGENSGEQSIFTSQQIAIARHTCKFPQSVSKQSDFRLVLLILGSQCQPIQVVDPENPSACTANQDANIRIPGSAQCTGVFTCVNGRRDCSASLFEVRFYTHVYSIYIVVYFQTKMTNK